MQNDINTEFNKLFNQYLTQNSLEKNEEKEPDSEDTLLLSNEQEEVNPLLSELLYLINKVNFSDNDFSEISQTTDNLINSGASFDSVSNILEALTTNDDDLVYTRTSQYDPYINDVNKANYIGGDLKSFINTSNLVLEKGQNVSLFVNAVDNILKNSDYDDLRYFLSLADESLSLGYDVTALFEKINEISINDNDNLELFMFGVTGLTDKGATLDEAYKIITNMDLTGKTGRDNITDLNDVLVEAKKRNEDIGKLLDDLFDAGNTKEFIEKWLDERNIQRINLLEYDKYERIESIIGKDDIVMKEGESVAIFARAISSEYGMLPEDVLYWSSAQTGALMNGDDHLDLSKLPAGTYDIYVKIGEGYGGTDTAKRKVVILDKNGNKVHNNNGLGDMKDWDNPYKGYDSSNPGHNKEISQKQLEQFYKQLKQERLKTFKEVYNSFIEENPEGDFLKNDKSKVKFVDTFNEITNKENEENNSEWLLEVIDLLEERLEEYRLAIKEFRKFVEKQISDEYTQDKEEKLEEMHEKSVNDFKEQVINNLKQSDDDKNILKTPFQDDLEIPSKNNNGKGNNKNIIV